MKTLKKMIAYLRFLLTIFSGNELSKKKFLTNEVVNKAQMLRKYLCDIFDAGFKQGYYLALSSVSNEDRKNNICLIVDSIYQELVRVKKTNSESKNDDYYYLVSLIEEGLRLLNNANINYLEIKTLRIESVIDHKLKQCVELKNDGSVALTHGFSSSIEFMKLIRIEMKNLLEKFSLLWALNSDQDSKESDGYWQVYIQTKENLSKEVKGSLNDTINSYYSIISNTIRKALNKYDLMLFDGRMNRISRIKMVYNKYITNNQSNMDSVIYNLKEETLDLDFFEGTIENKITTSKNVLISKKYDNIQELINLENEFYHSRLFLDEKHINNSENTNKDICSRYEIVVSYIGGNDVVINGLFNLHNLPKDYKKFINDVSFIFPYPLDGDIFDIILKKDF